MHAKAVSICPPSKADVRVILHVRRFDWLVTAWTRALSVHERPTAGGEASCRQSNDSLDLTRLGLAAEAKARWRRMRRGHHACEGWFSSEGCMS